MTVWNVAVKEAPVIGFGSATAVCTGFKRARRTVRRYGRRGGYMTTRFYVVKDEDDNTFVIRERGCNPAKYREVCRVSPQPFYEKLKTQQAYADAILAILEAT